MSLCCKFFSTQLQLAGSPGKPEEDERSGGTTIPCPFVLVRKQPGHGCQPSEPGGTG